MDPWEKLYLEKKNTIYQKIYNNFFSTFITKEESQIYNESKLTSDYIRIVAYEKERFLDQSLPKDYNLGKTKVSQGKNDFIYKLLTEFDNDLSKLESEKKFSNYVQFRLPKIKKEYKALFQIPSQKYRCTWGIEFLDKKEEELLKYIAKYNGYIDFIDCFKTFGKFLPYIDYKKQKEEKTKSLHQSFYVEADSKIHWNGTQKELAELFIELYEKGWIDSLKHKTIQNCFTKSNTIYQILKPIQDNKTKEKTYEGVYTKRYKAQFSEIKECTKNRK